MKYIFLIGIIALISLGFRGNDEIITISLGASCPMDGVKMKSVYGTEKALSDIKSENGLLVIFSCNTCPFVVGNGTDSEGWEGRYNGVFEAALKAKVGMVMVNSNHAKRDKGDGMEDMITHHREKGFKSDYVLDEESKLANAFGAKTTPHVFLFDKNMKLVYRGAIDDNVNKAADVKEKYLENALTQLSSGKKIKKNDTKAVGCSIKRVTK